MTRKNILASALLFSAITSFLACKKSDDNNTDQLATLGKATISGHVTAPLSDTSGSSTSQPAPAATVISAWIDTRDFVVNPSSANYARKYYTTTVDASGNYKLVVDVSKYQPATVTIMPQQFTYDQVHNTFGVVHHDSVYTTNHVFEPTPSTFTVSVYTDLSTYENISYN